jgi:glycosyltransferase involved in cell wall biosynthesis
MDILALVKSHEHVCCRYRLAAFRPFLEDAGHRLEIRPISEALSWGWGKRGDLGKADAVVLQRKLLSTWQLKWLRRQARQLIFDFDDAVFLRDSYAPGGLHNPRLLRRFVRTMQAADFVVAGNTFLAQQAACWIDPRRIAVIPTCVDWARYPAARHVSTEACQMVWIGSSSTLRGMTHIRPMLEHLGRQIPGLSLKIICDRSLELEHMPVQFCPWSTQNEAADLAGSDVGISWLPDDDWSRGKCVLKVLQYMAAGLPVVANPVGAQATLVQHGVTGFLAQTPEEWHQALERLSQSPALRQRLGARGRQVVRTLYEVRQGADAWLKVLAPLAGMTEQRGLCAAQEPGN